MTAAELDGGMPMKEAESDAHYTHMSSEEGDVLTEAGGSLYGVMDSEGEYEIGDSGGLEGECEIGDSGGLVGDVTDGSSHEGGALHSEEKSDKDSGTAVKKASDIPDEITEKDGTPPPETSLEESEAYYEGLMKSDIAELRAEFPELASLTDIRELAAPIRYAELRDLGLTAAEAYLLTARRSRGDTRGHLSPAFKVGASSPLGSMTRAELSAARDLFPGLSDSEIQRLYRNATK